jgi:hypothetical protein
MWRRVSCEQPLHTSQSILSPRGNPMQMPAFVLRFFGPRVGRKGIRSPFRNPVAEPFHVGPAPKGASSSG